MVIQIIGQGQVAVALRIEVTHEVGWVQSLLLLTVHLDARPTMLPPWGGASWV